MEQAEARAKEHDLQLVIVDSLYITTKPKGVVLEQYPKAGNLVKNGRHIFLTTNTFSPKMVPMPYVEGFSLRQAKNKLIGSGFVIGRISYKDDLATNNVLQQKYKNNTISSTSNVMGEIGSEVDLVVGLNPVDPEPVVPNIVGLTVMEAKNRLWESGFNIGTINMDNDVDNSSIDNAKVYEQLPLGARKAMYGRSVSFGVTLDNSKLAKSISDNSKDIEDYNRKKQLEEQEQANIDSLFLELVTPEE